MKSLITALWERAQGLEKVSSRNPDDSVSLSYESGGERRSEGGEFCLAENTSLLYSKGKPGDFGVYLAKNWRFELKFDAKTGECVDFTGFMSKLTAKESKLNVPDAVPRKLICKSDNMDAGKMCYSTSPSNSVHYDCTKKILCIGDPEAAGEAIEALDKTVFVLDNGSISAVYLILDNTQDKGEGSNLKNCLVLV